MYEIVDVQSKQRVGRLIKTRSTASRKADRLDLEYGAIRYIVRPVVVVDVIVPDAGAAR